MEMHIFSKMVFLLALLLAVLDRFEATTTTQPTQARVPSIGIRLPDQCGEMPVYKHAFSGEEDTKYVFKWAVFLEINRAHTSTPSRCVGTMITDRFVLTAAHCLQGLKLDDVTMYFGLFKRSELNSCLNEKICQERKAAQFIIHEEYKEDGKLNNIALIRTEDPIQTSQYIAPVCLPLNHTFDDSTHDAMASFGWGKTFDGHFSDTKKLIFLDVNGQGRCAESIRANSTVLASLMCTFGYSAEPDLCEGDDGAPLVQIYQDLMYVVGVVSYGTQCGTIAPGIAMRVSYYMDWILNTIRR